MKRIMTFSLFVMLLPGCSKNSANVEQAASAVLDNIPSESWSQLASQRIYFAHKSVGYNIVDGLESVAKSRPEVGLKFAETRNSAAFGVPVLAHATNGVNGDPAGKVAEFRKTIESGLGGAVDIAFMKLCWADFTPDTDITALFEEYRNTMAGLKASYPEVKFIHFTVPLTVVQSGSKALIKRILGRPVFGYAENVRRHQYNELLRKEYQGKEPLFDLAAWESTRPDGSQEHYTADGRDYPELVPEYTPDSGHLNAEGQRWVAAHLLAYLSTQCTTQQR